MTSEMLGEKPVPVSDSDTAPFWTAAGQQQFQFPKCRSCSMFVYPIRPLCPRCRSTNFKWTTLSGKGSVYSYCVMHMKLIAGFDPPYIVAQIELDDCPSLLFVSNIVECQPAEIFIGMAVEVLFEPRKQGVFIPLFKPSLSGNKNGPARDDHVR